MIQYPAPNGPYTSITTSVKKRDPFRSQVLIAPLAEISMSLCLVYRGGGRKITHNPKLPTGLCLEEEMVAALRRHPSIEGKAVIEVSHDPIRPTGMSLEEEMVVVIPIRSLHTVQRTSLAVTPHQS